MGKFWIFSSLQEKLFANLSTHWQKQIIGSVHRGVLTPFPSSGLAASSSPWIPAQTPTCGRGSTAANGFLRSLSTDSERDDFYHEDVKRIRPTFPAICPGFSAPSPEGKLMADMWVWKDRSGCFFLSQLQMCSCGMFLQASSKPTLNARVSGLPWLSLGRSSCQLESLSWSADSGSLCLELA